MTIDSSYFKRHIVSFTNNTGIEAHMLTSRGCPYRCVFCATAAFWQQVREHSIEHIYDEVKQLVDQHNVDSIIIWDDLFTYNKKKLGKLAEKFQREKLTEKVQFSCQLRTNLVDDQLCSILKRINVKTVSFGFDSGSDKTLNYLKKGTVSVEQNKNAIDICKKYGFKLIGSLMLGNPGETLEDMKKTVDFIDYMNDKGVDIIWPFVTTPFPGTELWEVARNKGNINSISSWKELDINNTDKPLLLDESVDMEDFKKIFEGVKQKIFTNFKVHDMYNAY